MKRLDPEVSFFLGWGEELEGSVLSLEDKAMLPQAFGIGALGSQIADHDGFPLVDDGLFVRKFVYIGYCQCLLTFV